MAVGGMAIPITDPESTEILESTESRWGGGVGGGYFPCKKNGAAR